MLNRLRLAFLGILMSAPFWCVAQLRVDTSYTPTELVSDVLLGRRVDVRNVRYVGSKLAIAAFKDSSETPLIQDGILISTGKVFNACGPNKRANTSLNIGTRGDHALEVLGKGMTFDAAYLEFDFVPAMETVTFNFVFGSEEYTEYVNTQFNDVFAFWISGPGYHGAKNLAVVPKNSAPITVNTVNHIYNRANYIDNNPFDRLSNLKKEKLEKLYPDLMANYEFDGFTTLLTAEARVKPGGTYHIKIAIADVSDGRYDSAVFLEGKSFTSLPLDANARTKILDEEYATVKRKFRPVRVGEDPTRKPGETATETNPELSKEEAYMGWRFMVNFEFDEAVLGDEERARLDSAWTYVLSKSTQQVLVQGHTDSVGTSVYNERLSMRRAQAVIAYLKSKGLPQKRIASQGFGYRRPATSNDTEEGRAVNRRVEINLVSPED
ncbi:MAG: OmpA family protein [Bacteroidia bacterium]